MLVGSLVDQSDVEVVLRGAKWWYCHFWWGVPSGDFGVCHCGWVWCNSSNAVQFEMIARLIVGTVLCHGALSCRPVPLVSAACNFHQNSYWDISRPMKLLWLSHTHNHTVTITCTHTHHHTHMITWSPSHMHSHTHHHMHSHTGKAGSTVGLCAGPNEASSTAADREEPIRSYRPGKCYPSLKITWCTLYTGSSLSSSYM